MLEAEWEEAVVHSPSVEMSVVLGQIFPFHCLRLQRKGNMDPFKLFCLHLSIFATSFQVRVKVVKMGVENKYANTSMHPYRVHLMI